MSLSSGHVHFVLDCNAMACLGQRADCAVKNLAVLGRNQILIDWLVACRLLPLGNGRRGQEQLTKRQNAPLHSNRQHSLTGATAVSGIPSYLLAQRTGSWCHWASASCPSAS